MNNTRKHLDILYNLLMVLLVLSAIGAFICLIAWISGEGAIPFIICAILSLSFYISAVLISVITDFYDAVVIKNKVSNAILNVIDEDAKDDNETTDTTTPQE